MKKIVKISLLLCISSLIYPFTPEQEETIQHYVKNPKEGEGFFNSIHRALGTAKGKLLDEADRRRNSSSSNQKDKSNKDSESLQGKAHDPFEGFDYTGDHFTKSTAVQKLSKPEASSSRSSVLEKEKAAFTVNEPEEPKLKEEARQEAARLKAKKTESVKIEKAVTLDSFGSMQQGSDFLGVNSKVTIKENQKVDLDNLLKLLNTDSKNTLKDKKEQINSSLQQMIDISVGYPLYDTYNEFLQKHINKIPGKFVTKFFEKFDQDISISFINTVSLEKIQYIPKDYFEKQYNLYKETKTSLPEFDKNKQFFIDIVRNGIESITPKDIESMDEKTREMFVKNLSPENTQKLSADQIKKILHDKNAQNSLKVSNLSAKNLVDALTKGTISGRSEISLTNKFQKSLSLTQLEAVLKVSEDQLRLSESDLRSLKVVYGALKKLNVNHS